MKNYVFTEKKVPCAVLMSGSGSNAEALLSFERAFEACPYHIAVLATDAPESSRAREIAARFDLPLVEHDIRRFYREHGEESIKLDSLRRRELREVWSNEFYAKIMAFAPRFACFAGFVPLSNIAVKLPCLNVHPGDLTRCDDAGVRLYAGLHVQPVERAILNGDGAKEMDAGAVLGISAPLPVEPGHFTLAELAEMKEARKPGVQCCDALRKIALEHIERLKIMGDHVVFPRVTADFAAGFFAVEEGQLFYRKEKILSVEYTIESAPRPLLIS